MAMPRPPHIVVGVAGRRIFTQSVSRIWSWKFCQNGRSFTYFSRGALGRVDNGERRSEIGERGWERESFMAYTLVSHFPESSAHIKMCFNLPSPIFWHCLCLGSCWHGIEDREHGPEKKKEMEMEMELEKFAVPLSYTLPFSVLHEL